MRAGAVLFDFGGTLDSNGLTWLDRFHPIYVAHGIHTSKEEFAKAFYKSDDHLPARFSLHELDLPRTLKLQVDCVLETLAPERAGDAQKIADAFLEESRRSLRRAEPVLRRLKTRWKLGIVSNFYGNLEAILAGEGLRGLFDAVADSGRLGCVKPEPAIFRAALAALGAAAGDSWMVGDSLHRDMRGAEAAGLRHAWLRGPQPASAVCCARARVLSSLDELEAALAAPAAAEARP